jgi:four helix bundle protein
MYYAVKILSFRDLDSWKEAYNLCLLTYQMTKKYPQSELFGLVSQSQRAAVSIASNIAEGFSRKSGKEKINFYYIALGSLTELRNQFDISLGLGYINNAEYGLLEEKSILIDKLIHGMIRSCKDRIIPYT